MNLWIIHPDLAAARALAATLATIWPEATCQGHAPDALPDIPAQTILISDQPVSGCPTLVLDSPRTLKILIKQIDNFHQQSQWPLTLRFDGAVLDTRTREWQSAEEDVTLTEKEVALLVYLWQKPEPASREDLLKDVWRYAADADTHTIETHIYRLRQKIETDPSAPVFLVTTKEGYSLAARIKA